MLKNAWNKALDYVPESVVNYFGGGRYINFDGAPHYVSGLRSIPYRPEFQAGMAVAAMVTCFEMAQQGTLDITNLEVLETAIKQTVGAGFGVAISAYQHVVGQGKLSQYNAAIDTEGRDISAKELSLNDAVVLGELRNTSKFDSCWEAGLFAAGFLDTSLPTAAMGASVLAFDLGRIIRTSKLLSGDYCFCDQEPPKETERSASVQGALAEPGV